MLKFALDYNHIKTRDRMRTRLICLLIMLCGLCAQGQVTIPFDVKTPEWKRLVKGKGDTDPYVHKEPATTSEIAVFSTTSDNDPYRWVMESDVVKGRDKIASVSPWTYLAEVSTRGEWSEVELCSGTEDAITGWVKSADIAPVNIVPLTKDLLSHQPYTLPWTGNDNEVYAVSAIQQEDSYLFYIGKLQDGYLFCPYEATIPIDAAIEGEGMVNGKLGYNYQATALSNENIAYIMANAKEIEGGCYFVKFGIGEGEYDVFQKFLYTGLNGINNAAYKRAAIAVEHVAELIGTNSVRDITFGNIPRHIFNGIKDNMKNTYMYHFPMKGKTADYSLHLNMAFSGYLTDNTGTSPVWNDKARFGEAVLRIISDGIDGKIAQKMMRKKLEGKGFSVIRKGKSKASGLPATLLEKGDIWVELITRQDQEPLRVYVGSLSVMPQVKQAFLSEIE